MTDSKQPQPTAQQKDLMSIISLLAGAAQAGAQGLVAQAALNVVLASEALVRIRKMESEQSIQDEAMETLDQAQKDLFAASYVDGAMAEAKQDIINNKQQEYNPKIIRH